MAGATIYAEVRQQRPPRRRHRIRLHRIDAPENPQPYGPDPAQCLEIRLRAPTDYSPM